MWSAPNEMSCGCVKGSPAPPLRIVLPPLDSATGPDREQRNAGSGPLNVALIPVLEQLLAIAGQVARIDASQGVVRAVIGEVQKDVAALVGELPSRGWRPPLPPEKMPAANAPLVCFASPGGDGPDLSGGGGTMRPPRHNKQSVGSRPSSLAQVPNKRNHKKKRTFDLFSPSTERLSVEQSMTVTPSGRAVAAKSDGFQRLQYLMEVADAQYDIEAAKASEREIDMHRKKSLALMFKADTPQRLEKIALGFDTVMAAVICVNAVVIAFSCDYSDVWAGWFIIDVSFVVFYMLEQALKVAVFGFRWLFVEGSNSRRSNCFDVMLTASDVFQLCWALANRSTDNGSQSVPSPALRLVRLMRLSRILRVFRIAFFRDMMTMINGMLGGIQTLGWSMILVLLPVYLVAIICRETLGRGEKEDVSYYFQSVPRSMFTIFRCSFGDCSTGGGMPVFELVHEIWGWPFSILYSLFIFSVTIGLFNVISAIFVENVITASTMNELRQKHQRLADEKLLARCVEKFIRCVLEHMDHPTGDRISLEMDSIQHLEVSTDLFDEVIKNPLAIQALDGLDIVKEDHDSLFDILDSDNSGGMLFEELLAGIEQLRGEPRRSDIVCVDLMLRSLQLNVNQILVKLDGGRPV